MLEHRNIHGAIAFGHADALAKYPNGFRRITAAAKPRQSRHPRIVPAVDIFFLHELQQLAFAQHRIS